MKGIEDIFYPFVKYYDSLPSFVRWTFAKLYNMLPTTKRLGTTYIEFQELVEKSRYWTKEQLLDYQNQEFLKTIETAKRTKFYPKYYKEHGIDINDIKSIKDITKLPFIDKSTLQSHELDLLADYDDVGSLSVTTGGSTGVPTRLYYTKGVTRSKEQAFLEGIWSEIGCKRESKSVSFRGKVTSSNGQEKLYKNDYVRNWLHMSSFHLNAENFNTYYTKINSFKPKYIQGYPSSITSFCKLLKLSGKKLNFEIKGVLCGSENISKSDVDFIEETLNAKLITWYGHSEVVVLGGFCNHSKRYHIYPQYGYTEMIDENENLIESGTGEIIGTNFHNKVFPLIRYKTSDRAKISDDQNCECRRDYLYLDDIEGRNQEFLVAEGKRLIGMASLIVHDSTFYNVKQYQFVQEKEESVTVRFTKIDPNTEVDEQLICKNMQSKMGKGITVHTEQVDETPLSNRGKLIPLIQKLKIEEYV